MPREVGEEAFGGVAVAHEADGFLVAMREVLIGVDDFMGDLFDGAFLAPVAEVWSKVDAVPIDLVADGTACREGFAAGGVALELRDSDRVRDLADDAEGFGLSLIQI